VRVIHQENGGLGAARNAAIPHVGTPYLTFLDSDDTLPENAWDRMLDTIRETGSDMVVGKLVRVAGQRRTVGRWMDVNHRRQRLRTTVEKTPEILADVFAVNKIFRRDFWDASALTFREDVRYEDQPTLTGAMLLATSIDVLPDTVYHWRTRVDGTSITQCRRDMKDITDRVATKLDSLAMVRDYAARRGHHHVTNVFLTKVLPVDMWEYFRGSIGNSDAYWRTLRQSLHTIWDEVPFHTSIVPVQQRLMGWLVEHDRQADLRHLLDWLDSTPPRERVREGLFLHPFRSEPGLPAEVTHVRPTELQLLAV
jgi:CDP-glycerol glycerophosphotransferase